ncbi:uncharacterized protein LOC129596639 [Paramacrobiotus metropolitanus]|uniref:uncharacterized protein LOC129596639 n=1 Tax=Paramacrobiotus metropolitanus TaxID=2943436 RepID=UPI0024465994|nr:uncharacterized protein LOC129596639 [Paramacrobiotus metropolitanus]
MNATYYNITNNANTGTVSSTAVWNYALITRMTLFILQVSFNTFMLLFLVLQKSLRTGFSVYLIGLLAANIFYAFGQFPVEIVQPLFGGWWMSRAVCSYYIYHVWVFVSVSMHMHVLITVNRLWALTFPLSYRNRHTTKLACLLSVGMVAYVHIVCLPLFLLDELYYRLPPEGEAGCQLNTDKQPLYSAIENIVSCDLPIKATTTTTTTGTNQKKDGGVRPFLILTLLTCSVLICWTPNQLYWTMNSFMDVSGLIQLENIALLLYPLQAILDPIVFALSLNTVRLALLQLWNKTAAYIGHRA